MPPKSSSSRPTKGRWVPKKEMAAAAASEKKAEGGRHLVIVESPAKTKLLKQYLAAWNPAASFDVRASFGHIRDLEKRKMGVTVEGGRFEPQYVILPDKERVVAELRAAAAGADIVWLASDLDREGEAIAWHLREVLGVPAARYRRVVFDQITAPAIARAFESPRDIHMPLVESQKGRRVVDRLVGFSLTQLLWRVFTSAMPLSAGRVQSAVMKAIVDRETAIAAFRAEPSYTVSATFEIDGVPLRATTTAAAATATDLKPLLNSLARPHRVVSVSSSDQTRRPPVPYITSTLQQDAYSRLHMGIQRTMKLAQELYEAGAITYMRSDSIHISPEFVRDQLVPQIAASYGERYIGAHSGPEGQEGGAGHKRTQDAHECIRPTHMDRLTPDGLSADHARLYRLIWSRTMAAWMAPAEMRTWTVEIRVATAGRAKATEAVWKGRHTVVLFDGYRRAYAPVPREGATDDEDHAADATADRAAVATAAPEGWKEGAAAVASAAEARETLPAPPARYNEASIVRFMEAEGIGRPSTYGSILQKLLDKNYVAIKDMQGPERDFVTLSWTTKGIKETTERRPTYSERARLVPSAMGTQITEFLRGAMPTVTDLGFTAAMETRLDEIAQGRLTYPRMMGPFYRDFMREYEAVPLPGRGEKTSLEEASGARQEFVVDGQRRVVRLARFGPVIETPCPEASAEKEETKTPPRKGKRAATATSDDECEKSAYLSLTPYLKATRRSWEDVTEADVAFLLSFPRSVKGGITVHYARYGFYSQRGEETLRIQPRHIEALRNGDMTPVEELWAWYDQKDRAVKDVKASPMKKVVTKTRAAAKKK